MDFCFKEWHAEYAIMVKDSQGNKLGYVPRKNNVVVANLMDAGKMVYASVHENRWYAMTPDVTIDLYMED
ncbi:MULTISPECIES: HIRAN domain-containing protein [unclassified Fibrobacter]|uniref:HIRAN domain-containing protein n=2 Tax=unclassified Fibrobacter TaxID=2634177 RepID=UPI00211088F4|nr:MULTISPECIES: HIRAN domain-containing protein [unclassified Fibrobacter]